MLIYNADAIAVPAPAMQVKPLPVSLPLFVLTPALTCDTVGHELCQVTLTDGLAAGQVAIPKHHIRLPLQPRSSQHKSPAWQKDKGGDASWT
jgi:hypothetical protein